MKNLKVYLRDLDGTVKKKFYTKRHLPALTVITACPGPAAKCNTI
jgi:hypothetical protein